MPDLVGLGITGFLLWLFAVAGWRKLYAPAHYEDLMAGYLPSLSVGRAGVLAVALVELGIALALLVPAVHAAGLVASAAALSLYAGLMSWQLARGRRGLRCGCAGPASDIAVSPALVVRNLVCALLALLPLLPPVSVVAGMAAGIGLALHVALFLIIAYLCCEHLIGNAQRMAGRK